MKDRPDCPYCDEAQKEIIDLMVDRAKLIEEIVKLRHRYEHLMGDESVRAQPTRLTGLH